MVCPLLCSKPRAGHSLISLGGTADPNTEAKEHGDRPSTQYTVLVFGGSDYAGTLYDDTIKCTIEIPNEEQGLHAKGVREIKMHVWENRQILHKGFLMEWWEKLFFSPSTY